MILLVLTLAFYWKLTLTNQYIWFDHSDMSYLELPRLQFQARELHRLRFPLWDPYIWCGQSLIGQTQPGPLFPLNLLFAFLPLDSAGYLRNDMLNWYFVAVHAMAALFCYAFCRELRLGRAAAILAGCAFAFGGFLGSVPWIDVMNGAIWAPLVLLYLARAVRGERPAANSALCGFFLGIAWLSGHHELPLMLSVLVAASWVGLTWRKPRLLSYAVLAFGIMTLVAAVQLLPTYEFARISKRWVGAAQPAGWNDRVPYTVHTDYSLPVQAVAETALPTGNTYADISPFLGAVVVALAIAGLAANWNRREVRWLAAVGAVALVYALGSATPLHGIVYAISPMMARARVPSRAILFVNLALAVWAAYGLESRAARSARWMGGAAIFLLAIAAARMYTGPPASPRLWLTALCLGGAALTRSRVLLIGLVLVELTPFAASFPHIAEGNQLHFASMLPAHRDLADFLRGQPDRIRIDINDGDVPENFGDWHSLEMLQGYVAGVPANLVDGYLHTERTHQILGVTHYLGKEPRRPEQTLLFTGTSGVKVYRNPDAMPRAWAVHQVESAPTDTAASTRLQDPSLDFHTTAVVTGPAPQLESCAGDRVEVIRHAANRITIRATMSCRGMVLLGDSVYPGWKARIDGRQTEIHSAYGLIRGVVVEAGTHEIDMRYQPASFFYGLVLTALGVVSTIVIAWGRLQPARGFSPAPDMTG